jgi:transposase InsO family protein
VKQYQQKDFETQLMIKCLSRTKEGRCPKGISTALWSVRQNLKMENGMLIFVDGIHRRWIILHSLRLKALRLAHEGHIGMDSTLSRVRHHMYWPHCRKDCLRFVKQCRICSLVKPQFIPASLSPFSTQAPMEIVAVDFVGPLPRSTSGFSYMLVFIDMFSRFSEVYPCTNMSVEVVKEKMADFMSRYGFPDAILSDRGSQFESFEYRKYLSKFGIRKLHTTAYHP